MLSETERAQALLYGLACGDALGYPVEFKSLDAIKVESGPHGIRDLPRPALYSDDTQMTLALARALIAAGAADLDTLMAAVSAEFVGWLRTQDDRNQRRAPGNACLAGAEALARGVAWQSSGGADAKGCGAVMRVAPVGYLYQHDLERLHAVASATGRATHGHPASDAATIGMAYLVKLALDGVEPFEMPYRMLERVGDLSREVAMSVGRVMEVMHWPYEEPAMRKIGAGWVAEEALALALYCFLRYPDDYVSAIVRGANCDGDSDSVACLAGALVAARQAGRGKFVIPHDWVQRIENSAEIATLGEGLATVKLSLPAGQGA